MYGVFSIITSITFSMIHEFPHQTNKRTRVRRHGEVGNNTDQARGSPFISFFLTGVLLEYSEAFFSAIAQKNDQEED